MTCKVTYLLPYPKSEELYLYDNSTCPIRFAVICYHTGTDRTGLLGVLVMMLTNLDGIFYSFQLSSCSVSETRSVLHVRASSEQLRSLCLWLDCQAVHLHCQAWLWRSEELILISFKTSFLSSYFNNLLLFDFFWSIYFCCAPPVFTLWW